MSTLTIKQQIIEKLELLTPEQQARALDFIASITLPPGTPGQEAVRLLSEIRIDRDDLKRMEQAIEEEFEKVDLSGWDLPA
jgi:hypothetical protein